MKKKTTKKDQMTNLANYALLLAGGIIAAKQLTDIIPEWLYIAAFVLTFAAGGTGLHYIGKGDNGQPKDPNPYRP